MQQKTIVIGDGTDNDALELDHQSGILIRAICTDCSNSGGVVVKRATVNIFRCDAAFDGRVCGGNLLLSISRIKPGKLVLRCDKCYNREIPVSTCMDGGRVFCPSCGYETQLAIKIGNKETYKCRRVRCEIEFFRYQVTPDPRKNQQRHSISLDNHNDEKEEEDKEEDPYFVGDCGRS